MHTKSRRKCKLEFTGFLYGDDPVYYVMDKYSFAVHYCCTSKGIISKQVFVDLATNAILDISPFVYA